MSDLGTMRGEGAWGVSTLTINPLTGEPAISLFVSRAEALEYARSRSLRGGAPDRSAGGPPDRSKKGKIYYVLHFESGDTELEPSVYYRVLRGMMGERKAHRDSQPERNIDGVLVFEAMGDLPNGGIKWDMIPGLSIRVGNIEAEREAAKDARGTERLSREDAGDLRRGHKGKIKQRNKPQFGPGETIISSSADAIHRINERRRVYERAQAANAAALNKFHEQRGSAAVRAGTMLHARIQALLDTRRRLETDYHTQETSRGEAAIEARIALVDEALDDLQRQYERLSL